MGQAARHGVDDGPDGNRHHPRVEVGAELALGLVASEVLLEDMYGGIDVRVDVLQAVGDEAASISTMATM